LNCFDLFEEKATKLASLSWWDYGRRS